MRSEIHGQGIEVAPIAPIALFILAASILIQSPARAAGEIEVSVSLSDTVMAATDSVILTCIVRWDKKLIELLSESPPTPMLKRLEIGAVRARSSSVTHEGRVYAQRTFSYTLKPLRSGLGMISPLQIGYVTLPDSSAALVSSRALTVRIVIPPGAVERQGPGWWLWLALIVGAGGAGVWLWQAKSRGSAGVNPHIEGIESQLRKLKALTSASRADFYSEAHRLLVHIQSPGLGCQLPQAPEATLAGWIAEASREKFAPGRGEPGEALRRFVEIESFVRTEVIERLNRRA